ncbi:purine and uridine phosphorylase [Aspergillus venezuelensis]
MSDDEQPPTNRYEPRPELERFQLGWICALPLEMTAAMAMLDVDYGPLHEREAGDNNVYWLGKIHHHHVVIATLPKKKYGTVSAALTARDMMRTFGKSLRFGLLVGIAGGIPRLPDQDIRLGDVVVSTPTGDSPGVYQYDLVKAEATQDATNFKKTGSLRPPSDDMLSVLTFFDSVDEAGRSKVPFYLRKGLNYTKKVKRTFAKPPTETDKLFNAANMHPRGARTCKDCPPEWEVERDPRDDDNPVVHYGIIGSGNAVIKDARVRESYADRLEGMLCFEMEAAGLMDHFPCLVFRGICDYADSHKNDAWQRYAAMTAAACAKEFLEYLPEESLASQRLVIEMIRK